MYKITKFTKDNFYFLHQSSASLVPSLQPASMAPVTVP